MDKTQNAVAVFDKLADLYRQKFMNVDLYADSLDALCKLLPENAAILELACGPGNLTRYLLDKRPDLKILATDLAPNMIALAKASNPEAAFEIMDCRAIGNLGKKYHAIVCGFGLPYLSDVETETLIGDASDVLHHDGLLYLSTMEGDYAQSGWEAGSSGDLVYMHYHPESDLAGALSQNGLSISGSWRKQYNGKNGPVTDLILLAKKN